MSEPAFDGEPRTRPQAVRHAFDAIPFLVVGPYAATWRVLVGQVGPSWLSDLVWTQFWLAVLEWLALWVFIRAATGRRILSWLLLAYLPITYMMMSAIIAVWIIVLW